ncbi:MAG: hypothetical protein IFK92_14735, partial [Acidobacteria bacterium]|nr:hypothetical protein [Candidatus Sulfomarinibacter kjeldsenii]
ATQQKLPPDFSQQIGFSDFVVSGREPFPEVVAEIYAEINETYGTNVPAPK